jgi:radical SAM superfamily enzyme YgiQ (UPF0313 family)
VWTTEGRRPRIRPVEKVIEEIRDLHAIGFRAIVFADDNFSPSTLSRIAREPSALKRREFERIRSDRLAFFDQFHRSAPSSFIAVTQLTAEITSDEEYLAAVHDKMRVRVALVGVESFTEEGLASANKAWNPIGQDMISAIHTMQERGILVLSSIICGLESDTPETLDTMRRFAKQSGAALTQFTIYSPFPGTMDFWEMSKDRARCERGLPPQRKIRLVDDKFWLSGRDPVQALVHPSFSSKELLAESRESFRQYYSFREIVARLRMPFARDWSLLAKITYVIASLAFQRLYGGRGFSADSVRTRTTGFATRLIVKIGITMFSHARHRLGHQSSRVSVTMPLRLEDRRASDDAATIDAP